VSGTHFYCGNRYISVIVKTQIFISEIPVRHFIRIEAVVLAGLSRVFHRNISSKLSKIKALDLGGAGFESRPDTFYILRDFCGFSSLSRQILAQYFEENTTDSFQFLSRDR
jgi:hypothetical protein